MVLKQYVVDAFTDRVFCGNPAAVCVLETWLPDSTMLDIARENNLSETAFTIKRTTAADMSFAGLLLVERLTYAAMPPWPALIFC